MEFGSQDVRYFLREYQKAYPEDVLTIEDRITDDQDATAFIWKLNQQGKAPLLHFRNVEGIACEVIANTFGSRERIARMFGTSQDRLHEVYQARSRKALPPRLLDSGPVTECVEEGDIDLNTLPMLKHFATDRAKYITSGIIIAEHPETGAGNLSYHRAMIAAEARLRFRPRPGQERLAVDEIAYDARQHVVAGHFRQEHVKPPGQVPGVFHPSPFIGFSLVLHEGAQAFQLAFPDRPGELLKRRCLDHDARIEDLPGFIGRAHRDGCALVGAQFNEAGMTSRSAAKSSPEAGSRSFLRVASGPDNVRAAIEAVRPWAVDSLTHTNRPLPEGASQGSGQDRSFRGGRESDLKPGRPPPGRCRRTPGESLECGLEGLRVESVHLRRHARADALRSPFALEAPAAATRS